LNYEDEKIKQFEAKESLTLEELVFWQTLKKKREKPEEKRKKKNTDKEKDIAYQNFNNPGQHDPNNNLNNSFNQQNVINTSLKDNNVKNSSNNPNNNISS